MDTAAIIDNMTIYVVIFNIYLANIIIYNIIYYITYNIMFNVVSNLSNSYYITI